MVKIRNKKIGLDHFLFIFRCVSGTHGLEVTNMPGTANVLGSILTGPFFSNGINSVSIKVVGLLFVCLCFCWLSCRIVGFLFLLYASYIAAAFSVLIFFCYLGVFLTLISYVLFFFCLRNVFCPKDVGVFFIPIATYLDCTKC